MRQNQLVSEQDNSGWVKDLLLITLFASISYFLFLGGRPLLVPDEGRYAEIGREMLSRADYITPYLNGIKYFEKPPLFYWLGAISFKLLGVTIWAARSINALIGIFGILSTYTAVRLLFDRSTAIIASIILATSTLYFIMAHMVSLDLPVTVFLANCLYAFLLATRCNQHKRLLLYVAAIFAALAVLTKGLIGIVFPGLIAFVWLAMTRKWRLLTTLPIISAFIIFLLVAAPWHVLVNHYNPEFFHFYFIEQHILRYTDKEIGHYQPVWFFIPVIIAGFFPWISMLAQSAYHAITQRNNPDKGASLLFFLCWAVIIFVFFSYSKSKLIPYILPAIPPLAVLVAVYLKCHLQKSSIGIKTGYGLFLAGTVAIAITFFTFDDTALFPNPHAAGLYLRIAASILALGGLLGFLYAFRWPRFSFIATSSASALFLIIFHASVLYIDTRSIRPLTNTLLRIIQPADDVITYNQYYQDLPFYLQKRVSILNWRNELTFGMSHQNTKKWMIDDDEFARRWLGKKRVFTIMNKDEYRGFSKKYPTAKIFIIDQTSTNFLVSNRR